MSSVSLLQSLKESISGQANVKAIYGDPISAQGKTVIPVAKLIYGYGAGAGRGGVRDSSTRGERRRRWWGRVRYSCGSDRGQRSADPLHTDH